MCVFQEFGAKSLERRNISVWREVKGTNASEWWFTPYWRDTLCCACRDSHSISYRWLRHWGQETWIDFYNCGGRNAIGVPLGWKRIDWIFGEMQIKQFKNYDMPHSVSLMTNEVSRAETKNIEGSFDSLNKGLVVLLLMCPRGSG